MSLDQQGRPYASNPESSPTFAAKTNELLEGSTTSATECIYIVLCNLFMLILIEGAGVRERRG
ncbi:hypothetical protein NEOLEDRAFT_1121729 [Neolentinus lepideus HHB14362 ss-1]|uniref:Uncharacterized protein n=1 Tax=Neolentinus lepideus HHB14362 ss-1 TaxID=1314782 RepID=A0A165PJA9_9AGAM|nr:hypothetical protein NEOLEDRAFT_1121729 [Neolentinus lepideus HHB14362 ss-1]